MKLRNQIEVMKSIRKVGLPQNRIERPQKGGGYQRPRNRKELSDE